MTNFKPRIFRFVAITAILLGAALTPRLGLAQDALVAADGTKPVDRHPLFTFDIRLGYDTNVNSTYANKQSSGFFNVGGGVTYVASSPRSTLTLGAGAGVSYFFDGGPNNQDYTFNANLNVAWTYKISQRMILSLATYDLYTSEPDFALVGVNTRISGNYFYSANRMALTYQWTPRFSTVVSYNPVFYVYQDQPYKNQQDRAEQYFNLELRYLIRPTISLVAEYRFGYIDYFYNNLGTTNLNSYTNYALAGMDVSVSPRLKFVFRAGAEFREYDNSNQPSTTSPFFEGRLNYDYMRNSTLTLITRYGLEQPYVTGYRDQEAFRIGILINQQVTRRITVYGAFYWVHSYYQGLQSPFFFIPSAPNFSENTYDLSLGARYSINRHFAVDIGYLYTTAQSQILLRSYDRNRVFAGVHFQF
jgi:opacity protein-like surface antigen